MPENPIFGDPQYVKQYVRRHNADVKSLNDYLSAKVGDGSAFPFGAWRDSVVKWKTWVSDVESSGYDWIDYWFTVQRSTELQSFREEWRWYRGVAVTTWPDQDPPPDVGWPTPATTGGEGSIGGAIGDAIGAVKWIAIAWAVVSVASAWRR